MKKPELIIGTRGSALALWQTELVQKHLIQSGQRSALKIIRTSGDNDRHSALSQMGGQSPLY